MIGPFANTTLIRTQIDADLTFQEAVNRVRDAVLEAYARQELPFDIIADRLAKEAGMDPASLIQVYFVLQVAFRRAVKLPHDDGPTVRCTGKDWRSCRLTAHGSQ